MTAPSAAKGEASLHTCVPGLVAIQPGQPGRTRLVVAIQMAAAADGDCDTGRMRHSAGGRRHAPDEAGQGSRAKLGPLAYWLVLAGTVAALAIMRQGVHLLRRGTLVLAGALLAAAAARLILSDRQAGLLSSRRRVVDVAIFVTLGVGLLVAGLVVPVPS